MASIKVWRGLLGLASMALLAACVETTGTGGGGGPISTGARATGGEIEAPEVFHAKDSALWDGRPSLGGIWVASPDAIDPERVVMFNPANGKTVTGALFRRERENPGPKLQLSSDAAEALGVLAGMPVEIEVTALRKAEVEEPVADETAAVEPAAADAADAADAGGEAEGGAAAVAAAALDAVDAGAAATDVADETSVEGTAEAKPKTRKEKRAEAKAAREAAEAAAASTAGAADGEAPPNAEAVAVSEIESAPLESGKPKAEEKTKDAEPEASAATAVSEPADPAPKATGGATRTIQIGSFSKEDNARRAAEALSKIDIAAEVKKVEKDGKIFWSVVARGDSALLQKIKDAGFADAYFLK